jgi:hypothetical protein
MGAELLDRTRRLQARPEAGLSVRAGRRCDAGGGSNGRRGSQEIVTVASGSTSLPFTVKIRVGHFEDAARRHAHTLIPQLARWGAAAVTLHGRSRQQRYSREADWDYIRTCAAAGAAVGVPVLGNGDVLTWEVPAPPARPPGARPWLSGATGGQDYHNRGTDVASCMSRPHSRHPAVAPGALWAQVRETPLAAEMTNGGSFSAPHLAG